MPSCPQCGGVVEENYAFCPHCGRSLKEREEPSRAVPTAAARQGGTAAPVGVATTRPVVAVASARPVTPPAMELAEERTLLQRTRPVVEGIGLAFAMGLVYMVFSLNVAKSYTPLLDFYKQVAGLIWPAILLVGSAWAGKDERENSFLSGAVAGAISGLLLAFSEDSIHQWRTLSLRHTLAPIALGAVVGVVGGTAAGVLGSPVMVRLPSRQKHWALGLFILLMAFIILTVSLPPEPADYFMEVGAIYYSKAREVVDGDAYFHRGLLRLARRYFETAIERDPRLANAHNNLAVVLQEMGDDEGSFLQWRQAQILDPTLPEPYKNLGTVYLERGLREGDESLLLQSVGQYQKYLNLAPAPDANALYNLALALYQLGDSKKAIVFAQEASQIAPDDARISTLLQELRQAKTASPPEGSSASPVPSVGPTAPPPPAAASSGQSQAAGR